MSLPTLPHDLNQDFLSFFLQIAQYETANTQIKQEEFKIQPCSTQPETLLLSQQPLQQNILQISNNELSIKQEDEKEIQNRNKSISEGKKENQKSQLDTQEKPKALGLKKNIIKQQEKPQKAVNQNFPEEQNRRSSRNKKKTIVAVKNFCENQLPQRMFGLTMSQLEEFKQLFEKNTNKFLMFRFGISRHRLFKLKEVFNLVKDLTYIQKTIQNKNKKTKPNKKTLKQSGEIVEKFVNLASYHEEEEEQSPYQSRYQDLETLRQLYNLEDSQTNKETQPNKKIQKQSGEIEEEEDEVDIQIVPEIEEVDQEKNEKQDLVGKKTKKQSPSQDIETLRKIFKEKNSLTNKKTKPNKKTQKQSGEIEKEEEEEDEVDIQVQPEIEIEEVDREKNEKQDLVGKKTQKQSPSKDKEKLRKIFNEENSQTETILNRLRSQKQASYKFI